MMMMIMMMMMIIMMMVMVLLELLLWDEHRHLLEQLLEQFGHHVRLLVLLKGEGR